MFHFLVSRQIFGLIGPAVLAIFAFTFLLIWLLDRARLHILYFAAAFFIYGLAATAQIVSIPNDPGLNIVLASVLYASGALFLVEGLSLRASTRIGKGYYAAAIFTLVGLVAYFQYIDDNQAARVYVLNLGMALIFLAALARLGAMRRGMLSDRILYWAFCLFALHFVPRSLLTINTSASVDNLASSPLWVALQIVVPLFGFVLALALLATSAADTIADLQREKDTDPLTGLLNRRGFEVRARALVARLSEDDASLSVIVCDIDHFKSINDTYGHRGGDIVLQAIATILKERTLEGDLVARIGGEEFVVLMEGADAMRARALAERLRQTLESTRFGATGPLRSVTASFGIAEHRHDESLWDLVSRADRALYAAKSAGRNRSLIDDPENESSNQSAHVRKRRAVGPARVTRRYR